MANPLAQWLQFADRTVYTGHPVEGVPTARYSSIWLLDRLNLARRSVDGDTVMAMPMFFVQECPTCGRNLEIRVEYLGKSVSCRHCRGQFMAIDPASTPAARQKASDALMQRAEELLALAEQGRFAQQASLASPAAAY